MVIQKVKDNIVYKPGIIVICFQFQAFICGGIRNKQAGEEV